MENIIFLLNTEAIIGLAVALLGGGFLGGIAAFRKAKPEMAKTTIEIVGQGVIVQKGVIELLQNELIRQGTELTSIENENEKLKNSHSDLVYEHKQCMRENAEFKRTIEELQKQLTHHSTRIDNIEKKQ